MQASNSHSCKTNKAQQIKAYNVDVNDVNSNMQDYFRSSTNKAAYKRASKDLMNKIHNEFNNDFQEWMF